MLYGIQAQPPPDLAPGATEPPDAALARSAAAATAKTLRALANFVGCMGVVAFSIGELYFLNTLALHMANFPKRAVPMAKILIAVAAVVFVASTLSPFFAPEFVAQILFDYVALVLTVVIALLDICMQLLMLHFLFRKLTRAPPELKNRFLLLIAVSLSVVSIGPSIHFFAPGNMIALVVVKDFTSAGYYSCVAAGMLVVRKALMMHQSPNATPVRKPSPRRPENKAMDSGLDRMQSHTTTGMGVRAPATSEIAIESAIASG
nr:hypothetical protein HK105_008099 [Polyrhizophydium stewartii]